MLSTKKLSCGLLLSAALVLTACTDPGPVAPNTSRADAIRSPSLVKASGVSENYTVPVGFVIPGGTCGLNTTVTGTGLFHIVTRSTQDGTGRWHVSFSWDAHGTATGADGSSYRFNYAINARSVDPSGPNDLAIIDIVDHFNLLGQGKTPDLKVYLNGTFTFPAFNPIDAVIRGPGIACDPI
jgi:hypothetical protein